MARRSKKNVHRRSKKRVLRRKRESTRRNRKTHKGGMNLALVGAPVEANPSTWPGNAPNNGGNHYPLNTYENTPFQHLQPTRGGGRRRRRKGNKTKKNKKTKKRRQKGGSGFFSALFPETYLAGQNIQHSAGNTLNTINGYQASADPKPWVQPELLKVQQRMI
jgi:hypothetical protein|uniref:Uncharacterized protein n=1 Tax=viral metagenome TaxID=1070528 RepID=A0A6C0EIZ9_9ZZZZ